MFPLGLNWRQPQKGFWTEALLASLVATGSTWKFFFGKTPPLQVIRSDIGKERLEDKPTRSPSGALLPFFGGGFPY